MFIKNLRTRGRRLKGIENRRAKRKSKPIGEPTVDVQSGSQFVTVITKRKNSLILDEKDGKLESFYCS